MSQALRLEMVEHGIRVTNVQPGDVETEISNYSTDKEVNNFIDCISYEHSSIILMKFELHLATCFSGMLQI